MQPQEAARTAPPTEPRPTDEAEPATAAPAGGAAWQADGVIGNGEYPNSTEAAGVTFYWSHDGENLYAALSAPTAGWVSVGFDPETRMQGANFVFGYVADGAPMLADMYGLQPAGPGSHPPDEDLGGTDDFLASAGSEENGVTVIEFSIPLDSGDEYDRPLTAGTTYTIILAMGSVDDFDSYHSARGTTEITLD